MKKDFAILKIAGIELPTVRAGDSNDVVIGDEVVAIGTPFSLPGNVSVGRVIHIRTGADFQRIEYTAPVSPGNSGGPLLNRRGEVIGINTLIGGRYFALPFNHVRDVLAHVTGVKMLLGELREPPREIDELLSRSKIVELVIPRFPWPPPAYSAFARIPGKLMHVNQGTTRLHDIANRLESALGQAGYGERTYFSVPDGFALVSRLERIRDDATPWPEPGRWSVKSPNMLIVDLTSYVRALFQAPEGNYRVIVFIVTDKPFATAEEELSVEEAIGWLRKGVMTLPPSIGQKEYSEGYYTSALVYEFERKGNLDPARRVPGNFLGQTHLERAGIWKALLE